MKRNFDYADERRMNYERNDVEYRKEYGFSGFAEKYFQKNETFQHTKSILKKSLLPLQHDSEQLAALATWITLLRFMGDLPDAKTQNFTSSQDVPVMTEIYTKIRQKFTRSDVQKVKKMVSSTEKYSCSSFSDISSDGDIDKNLSRINLKHENELCNNPFLEKKQTNNIRKIQFIIGMGIAIPNLRDEIYCQICKQLSENKNRKSFNKGWILLSLCVACFAPTNKFVNYLENFIQNGPTVFSHYCIESLKRTRLNGPRKEPPGWLEMKSFLTRTPVRLPITLMNGDTQFVCADSSSTICEICDAICDKIGLSDKFGFSLYIGMFSKVTSLGSGPDHIMDAISQFEQYAKIEGCSEQNAPWRLFFRKEIFAPWHNPKDDLVATSLIYEQIVRGIKFDEYRCEKEDDLAMITAQQHYIENGDTNEQMLKTFLPNYCIPYYYFNNGSLRHLEKWTKKVMNTYNKVFNNKNRLPKHKVKENIVSYSMYKWPLLFSRFYEAYSFNQHISPKTNVIIAVNFAGIFIIDDQEQILFELSYPEIKSALVENSKESSTQNFIISTIKGDIYTFKLNNSNDIRGLVVSFLNGLKDRSCYAIAFHDYVPSSDFDTFLTIQKGDLVILKEPGLRLSRNGYYYGTNDRTGYSGSFPRECVYVLPTITKPPSDILQLYALKSIEMANQVSPSTNHSSIINPNGHTLKQFSYEHFRRPNCECLWLYQNEPIYKPLLKSVNRSKVLAEIACQCFLAILRYIDPPPAVKITYELTDVIFKPALKNKIMKDEIYCQLLKQLTGNPNTASENRTWQLLWLATGCFAPSVLLQEDVILFLQTRQLNLASECLRRMQAIIKNGQRKHAPHQIEVETIQEGVTRIFHKIYFPNGNNEKIEINSTMKVKTICKNICKTLEIDQNRLECFSLCMETSYKTINIIQEEFIFDCFRDLKIILKDVFTSENDIISQLQYRLVLKRKVWTNLIPGINRKLDTIFHYPKELSSYLHGYHNCSIEDAIELAACIYRSKFGSDTLRFNKIDILLCELVPQYLHNKLRPKDWRKEILNEYMKMDSLSVEDAKIRFLEILYYLPTFGSDFFQVKLITESNYPILITLAINKRGIILIDPQTKEILRFHRFKKISSWNVGNNYFRFTSESSRKKWTFETNYANEISDLTSNYMYFATTMINN